MVKTSLPIWRALVRALPHVAWRDDLIEKLTATGASTAQDLAHAREELAALERNSVESPSFRRYLYAERRIVKHMGERNKADRGNIVTRKLKSYAFAQSHGVDVPTIFGLWDRPESIAWDVLPDHVVIKSHTGTSGRGVFPLRRVDKDWSLVTTTDVITAADIVAQLKALEAERLVGGPYFAEELLGGGVANAIPPDFKVFAFDGEVGLFYIRLPTSFRVKALWKYHTFLEDGTDPGSIFHDHPNDDSVLAPCNYHEIVAVARRLSLSIPLAFVRVDLYDVDGRIVFGELTPRPGGPMIFDPEHDERLGHLWERAHARLLNDFIDGATPMLKYGPGPRELQVKEVKG